MDKGYVQIYTGNGKGKKNDGRSGPDAESVRLLKWVEITVVKGH